MTTTNGGSQGRITEYVEGRIASVNDRGLRLDTETDWRNWSRWADKPAESPRRGARVRLGLDASGFVRQLEVLDPVADQPTHDRDWQIRRMSALCSAATFCAGKALSTEVSSKDVLAIAEAFERWLEQEPR